MNLGLIKYYFDGKERLWQESVGRSFEELAAGLGEALEEAGPYDDRGRMALLVRRYVRWVAANPEFVRLIHEEGKRDGPRMHWLVDRYVRPFFEATMQALKGSQNTGFLPPHIDAIHFHYILIGAVALIFHQAPECRRLTGRDPSDDSFVEAHADAVTHLFFGPPEATPE